MTPAPDEILAHRDLCSVEGVLGAGDERRNPEGSLAFGRPAVLAVPEAELPAPVRRRLHGATRVLLAQFPLDLREPLPGRDYRTLTFSVTLNDVECVSLWLRPPEPTDATDADTDADAAARRAGWHRLGTAEDPGQIVPFGLGTHDFSWRFTSAPGWALSLGSRVVRALLEVPSPLDALHGVLSASAEVERSFLGRRTRFPVDSGPPVAFKHGLVEPV